MADLVDLEARLAAMEMILVTQLLQSGVATPGFDPHAFAGGRRDAWAAIGAAICEECTSDADERRFTQAYAAALERIGHLLVALAAPVQEAIDEVDELRAEPSRRPA
jgi:hypothetical protein